MPSAGINSRSTSSHAVSTIYEAGLLNRYRIRERQQLDSSSDILWCNIYIRTHFRLGCVSFLSSSGRGREGIWARPDIARIDSSLLTHQQSCCWWRRSLVSFVCGQLREIDPISHSLDCHHCSAQRKEKKTKSKCILYIDEDFISPPDDLFFLPPQSRVQYPGEGERFA